MGLRPHGEDVGKSVGGGDAAEIEGVVDDRGEEVDGQNSGEVVIDHPDRGIVARFESERKASVDRRSAERFEGGKYVA